jgi:hypothetical protein
MAGVRPIQKRRSSMSIQKRFLTVRLIVGVTLLLVTMGFYARGPSTSEEREKALTMIRNLEENPLQENYKDMRSWLINWLTEVPDIEIKVCSGPFQPLLDEKKEQPFGPDIYFQVMISSAAFIIEHPDKAKDQVSIYQAGLEGALKVYKFYVAKNPEARRKYIDDLLVKQQEGKLAEVAKKAVKECK